MGTGNLGRWAPFAVAAVVSSMAVDACAYQSAGSVRGRVVDERGRPVAGATVTARYQSNPGGVSYSRSATTDANGNYSIRVADRPGAWSVHAQARVDGMQMNLTPSSEELFASNASTVRNFSVRYAEQTADSAYGSGGMVVVNSSIGDYTPMEEVEVTLRPVGGGEAITRRLRATGEGYVVTGLRPQTYEVTARHNGRPLQMSLRLTPTRPYRWGPSVTAALEPGPSGRPQLAVEVRAR
ncbi:MAG: carboxypeptidase regulatory-like domain-containing protein [Brevundimonas sp.]|nr:MAG: carboxypeptidase regulatory-like domain-containing protein [Brevundimonas sp.]